MSTDANLWLATCAVIASGMAIQAAMAPQAPAWGFYEQAAFVIVGVLWGVRGTARLLTRWR